ncbi:hypothetical protein OMP40_20490 [Cohnella rhizosphaerae]|uniref:Uncharacterized protein n=1 Tax=Cohnella rhizosphaerae TaxID=1457232 RepID=A0A9X4QVH4_9BACL|nr:hypothetical protein [Cohnella rhizosphaerae]MDG0811482.1 hypothetical protein [Cohnella rhizosphaerae]
MAISETLAFTQISFSASSRSLPLLLRLAVQRDGQFPEAARELAELVVRRIVVRGNVRSARGHIVDDPGDAPHAREDAAVHGGDQVGAGGKAERAERDRERQHRSVRIDGGDRRQASEEQQKRKAEAPNFLCDIHKDRLCAWMIVQWMFRLMSDALYAAVFD